MTTSTASLLDIVLPRYDVSACYSIRIQARPERIYRVLQEGVPTGAITRILMGLRNMPRILKKRQSAAPKAEDAFYRLMQLENREIVIGIIGQFWRSVSTPLPIEGLDEFVAFERPGYSKAAMNLRITPLNAQECKVTTETRVVSYGKARENFKNYWQVVGPFSGMIRKEILRKIKSKAEQPKRDQR